jgi:hypothetical protein
LPSSREIPSPGALDRSAGPPGGPSARLSVRLRHSLIDSGSTTSASALAHHRAGVPAAGTNVDPAEARGAATATRHDPTTRRPLLRARGSSAPSRRRPCDRSMPCCAALLARRSVGDGSRRTPREGLRVLTRGR